MKKCPYCGNEILYLKSKVYIKFESYINVSTKDTYDNLFTSVSSCSPIYSKYLYCSKCNKRICKYSLGSEL